MKRKSTTRQVVEYLTVYIGTMALCVAFAFGLTAWLVAALDAKQRGGIIAAGL